jgi:mRNA-degrading endonuclease HigB of HigAB toxin-antitoxin module
MLFSRVSQISLSQPKQIKAMFGIAVETVFLKKNNFIIFFV